LQDLQLVFAACPGLETLKLSSCAFLEENALHGLLPELPDGKVRSPFHTFDNNAHP
jgi:hypothetical protein